jgi:hypothetical protein
MVMRFSFSSSSNLIASGDLGCNTISCHGAEKNIDLIYHDAWNLYQIAKVYPAEYDKLA